MRQQLRELVFQQDAEPAVLLGTVCLHAYLSERGFQPEQLPLLFFEQQLSRFGLSAFQFLYFQSGHQPQHKLVGAADRTRFAVHTEHRRLELRYQGLFARVVGQVIGSLPDGDQGTATVEQGEQLFSLSENIGLCRLTLYHLSEPLPDGLVLFGMSLETRFQSPVDILREDAFRFGTLLSSSAEYQQVKQRETARFKQRKTAGV